MKKHWMKIAMLAVLSCLAVKYSDAVIKMVLLVLNTVQPLVFGFAIAYVLDILMKKLEKLYFPKRQDAWVKKTRRPVCLFGSIFLVLFLIVLIFLLVIPALRDAVLVMTKDIPKSFTRFQTWAAGLAAEAGYSEIQNYVSTLKIDWNSMYEKLGSFLYKGVDSLFNSAFSVANVVVSFTFTGVISVIFAIYMLFQKENLRRQLKKAAAVYLPERFREKFEAFTSLAHDTFTSFITGQILEAIILGSLCAGGMFLLRIPYALMVGVVVGASALIPVMGAYIGAFIGAFMIMTVNPAKAFGFLVYLVILQQLEGNLIYPRVVGGSIGLPGIWVLAAVTVGGGLFGIVGMLIGVPLTATLYKWIRNDVNMRIANHTAPHKPRLVEAAEQFFEEK